jgi:dihydrofolate reductase
MRPIIMFNRVSADGYFADPAGGLGWTVPDDALDQAAADGTSSVDAMLFGRKTYDIFESYWPSATSEDPHAAGRHNDAIGRMARWINQTPKLVFSRTRKQLPWENSELLGPFTPERVRALKELPGKSILVFGSGSIVAQLSQHRLIDEYRFVVGPVLLGKGRLMLDHGALGLSLELREAKTYPSGNVLLTYGPRPS